MRPWVGGERGGHSTAAEGGREGEKEEGERERKKGKTISAKIEFRTFV